MTDRNPLFRLPAEWEMEGAVLLAWPHEATDWAYMLDDVRQCFKNLVGELLKWTKVIVVAPDTDEASAYLAECGGERLFFFKADTNDTWTRDYGPLSLQFSDGTYSIYDFRFNGWGLKFAACHDNLVTGKMVRAHMLTAPVSNRQGFVMEGGGIESDGQGLLMTTAECQLSPNRNPELSEQAIKEKLLELFGARKLIWLTHGYLAGDDTDSHVDTLARFAPGNTIVFTGCDDETDEHYTELQAMKRELMEARTLNGQPFNLVELPLPDAIYDEDQQRLPATYANFLALPNVVLMPTYGQPRKDALAQQLLRVAFDVPVVAVDCRALIRQHGSLHCMTMQLPKQILAL